MRLFSSRRLVSLETSESRRLAPAALEVAHAREAHRDAVERYRTGRAHRPVDARVRPRAFERVNERPAHE